VKIFLDTDPTDTQYRSVKNENIVMMLMIEEEDPLCEKKEK